MPLIECTLIKGYDSEVRKRLAERVTDAACSSIGAASEFVTVTIKEVAPDNYMRGRTKRVPASAPRPAEDIVRAFLASMEARDLDSARSYLSEGFTMTFPGAARFTALEELVTWARERYQSVSKAMTGSIPPSMAPHRRSSAMAPCLAPGWMAPASVASALSTDSSLKARPSPRRWSGMIWPRPAPHERRERAGADLFPGRR